MNCERVTACMGLAGPDLSSPLPPTSAIMRARKGQLLHNSVEGQARRKARYSASFKEREGITLSAASRRQNRVAYLVSRARLRASKAGRVFNIVADELERPTHCPILGIEIDYANEAGKVYAENGPSLDRVNNDLGYERGNVRIISRRANMLKSRFDAATFRRMADYCEGKI